MPYGNLLIRVRQHTPFMQDRHSTEGRSGNSPQSIPNPNVLSEAENHHILWKGNGEGKDNSNS